jgi:hypothetical protein
VDLADNDLILDYTGSSPLSDVRAKIIEGWNSGSWTGGGITSGVAASVAADSGNSHKTALGYAEASTFSYTSFGGQTVDSTTVLVKYTWNGDANLDGRVNAIDFNILASNNPASSGKLWSDADFNYDGAVDTTPDYYLMAPNFGQPQL